MRTPLLVSAVALSLGLAFVGPTAFAQEASEREAVTRWPTATDGRAGASNGGRITVAQGPLEQRRSPGGGGGGGGAVRGGSGGSGGGGARVAVPRGSVDGGGGRPGYPGGGRYPYPGGRYYGGYYPRYYYPYAYPYPYYYPYSSFYWGGGYFNSYGYWGAGVGWPGYAYPAYPYPGYGYGYDTGRVRLEVQPRDAEVFIDGSFAGTVDNFDGRLQGLTLETGGYNVEIRKPGWETLTFDVRITPGRTTHYKGELLPKKE